MFMYKTTVTLLLFIFFYSCSTKKDIIYMNNEYEISDLEINYLRYKIKVDDILKIDIISDNSQVDLNTNNNADRFNKTALLYSGFKVNGDGYISYPNLGDIKALDMTITELSDYILEQVISKEIHLPGVIVDIKLVNSYFSVLGEVNSPGRYEFLENNLNFLEALSMAGDITITGDRNNIRVLREDNDKLIIKNIDISKYDFVKSEFFQIQSGDIIVVNPNKRKIQSAGVIASPSNLFSILSFIMSGVLFLRNIN